ncbi:P-loop containing nucleoside triphosphate hydrolase protein [Panaeolus papilionaceus]|nr:P-loop containing nucleoside triphosphate hydrolase protein [Panaeolus papilionaceus]
MKRKEGDLVKRRESPHGVSLAGHGPATEVQDSLELSEDDFIIAVMGPTGAGKSTFIRNATGYDKLEIGDDLESCTSEIHVIRFGDSDIYIVDTPGFNDTNRTDLDIFKLISEWLEKRFTNQVYLSGLIYLHRISDNRMGGTTLKNFQIFEKLCGKDCFHKVTLATTMWDDVDEDTGKERERQLRDDYFSYVVRNGARFERLQNSPESAKGLIEEIINDATDLRPLSLQKELVAYNKDLRHTDAGRKMYDKLDDVLRSHHAALQQLNRDLRTEKSEQVQILLKKEHEELTQELMALIADMQYMQLGLPTRLRNFIAGVVGKK